MEYQGNSPSAYEHFKMIRTNLEYRLLCQQIELENQMAPPSWKLSEEPEPIVHQKVINLTLDSNAFDLNGKVNYLLKKESERSHSKRPKSKY